MSTPPAQAQGCALSVVASTPFTWDGGGNLKLMGGDICGSVATTIVSNEPYIEGLTYVTFSNGGSQQTTCKTQPYGPTYVCETPAVTPPGFPNTKDYDVWSWDLTPCTGGWAYDDAIEVTPASYTPIIYNYENGTPNCGV